MIAESSVYAGEPSEVKKRGLGGYYYPQMKESFVPMTIKEL